MFFIIYYCDYYASLLNDHEIAKTFMNNIQAVILAGGMGTRLRPLTLTTPKPILPICNRPFLTYQFELLKTAGIKDIILSLNYKPTKIKKIIGSGSKFGVSVKYLVEPQPMGTAGAFKFAETFIKGTTVVLNGDSFLDFNIQSAIREHNERKALATIVLTKVENSGSYGTVKTSKSNRVLRFSEKQQTAYTNSTTINAGVYILEPEVLDIIPVNKYFMFETDVFQTLLSERLPFYAHIPKNSYFIDIGTPQNFLQANMDFLSNNLITNAALNLFEVGTQREYSSKFKQTLIANSCAIEHGAEIFNSVVGEKCFIGKDVKIYNSVILENVQIQEGSKITSCIIGNNSFISENCSLNNFTLGENTHIASYTHNHT